jgi:hypothetical protein
VLSHPFRPAQALCFPRSPNARAWGTQIRSGTVVRSHPSRRTRRMGQRRFCRRLLFPVRSSQFTVHSFLWEGEICGFPRSHPPRSPTLRKEPEGWGNRATGICCAPTLREEREGWGNRGLLRSHPSQRTRRMGQRADLPQGTDLQAIVLSDPVRRRDRRRPSPVLAANLPPRGRFCNY